VNTSKAPIQWIGALLHSQLHPRVQSRPYCHLI